MGLEHLSDDELIRRFLEAPQSQGGHEAFEQLWTRYRSYVEHLSRAMSFLVPSGSDRQVFLKDAVQQTSVNLMRRMHGYRGPERFRNYLKKVAATSVLDERRTVLARLRGISAADRSRGDDPASPDETGVDAIAFRSRYYFPTPATLIQAHERRVILRGALAIHGQQSQDGTKSVVAIRWRCWEDEKIGAIAQKFRVDERTIYRWLHDDYRELRTILSHHFGIQDIGQI